MATKEQLKTWIVDNQDKQGKEGKDGQDFEKVKSKYLSLRGKTSRAEADAKTDVKTGDYSLGAERARTAAQGLTLGFADEIEAGGRSLFSDSKYKDIRDEIRQNTKDYRTDNPGEALALEMAGGVVIPGGIARTAFKTAIKTGAKKGMPFKVGDAINKTNNANAVTLKQAAGANAGLGGAYGLGVSESENVSGMAADTALGATIGGVAGSAIHGIGRQFKPLVSGYSRNLAKKAMARDKLNLEPGFVTKGTAEGGLSDSFEKQLSNVANFVKEAKNKTLGGYNVNVATKVLEVGTREMNPKLRTEFRKRLAEASSNEQRSKIIGEAFSSNYDEAFKGLEFRQDATFNKELSNWFKKSTGKGSSKSPEEIKILSDDYDLLLTRVSGLKKNAFGKENGSNINEIIRELADNAKIAKKGAIAGNSRVPKIAKERKELENLFKKSVGRQSGKAAKLLESTKASYKLKVAFDKTVDAGKKTGIFTPGQVRQVFTDNGFSMPAKIANRAQAKSTGGDGIAEEAAEYALEAIGQIQPDSGTAGAIASTGSILGIGGLIGSGAILAPGVLVAIAAVAAKAFQYSPFMLRRFNKMIADGKYRQSADMLEKYGTGSGLAGTEINQLANELRQGR